MTLSCKEVTATMAQELEQPIYVKPNRGDAYETLTVETGVRGSGSIFNRLIDCVF